MVSEENVFDGLLWELTQDLTGVIDTSLDSNGRAIVTFNRTRIITGVRIWDHDRVYQGIHEFTAIDVIAGNSIQFVFTPEGHIISYEGHS